MADGNQRTHLHVKVEQEVRKSTCARQRWCGHILATKSPSTKHPCQVINLAMSVCDLLLSSSLSELKPISSVPASTQHGMWPRSPGAEHLHLHHRKLSGESWQKAGKNTLQGLTQWWETLTKRGAWPQWGLGEMSSWLLGQWLKPDSDGQ